MKKHKLIMIAALALTLVSCSDPAFQQYVNNRQAAINGMRNGTARENAQYQLDMAIYADKQRQQQQAAAVAVGVASAALGVAEGIHAARSPWWCW